MKRSGLLLIAACGLAAASPASPASAQGGASGCAPTWHAIWVHRGTGEQVRRFPQRVGLSWFALLPPAGCPAQPAVELAVPGGVRKADT